MPHPVEPPADDQPQPDRDPTARPRDAAIIVLAVAVIAWAAAWAVTIAGAHHPVSTWDILAVTATGVSTLLDGALWLHVLRVRTAVAAERRHRQVIAGLREQLGNGQAELGARLEQITCTLTTLATQNAALSAEVAELRTAVTAVLDRDIAAGPPSPNGTVRAIRPS